MFGPLQLFGEDTYLSNTDGSERSYYAPIPFAGLTKELLAGLALKSTSTNGQVRLELEYSFDGCDWLVASGPAFVSNTNMAGWHPGTSDAAITGIARAVMIVSDSTTAALESVTLKGVWISGKAV